MLSILHYFKYRKPYRKFVDMVVWNDSLILLRYSEGTNNI